MDVTNKIIGNIKMLPNNELLKISVNKTFLSVVISMFIR